MLPTPQPLILGLPPRFLLPAFPLLLALVLQLLGLPRGFLLRAFLLPLPTLLAERWLLGLPPGFLLPVLSLPLPTLLLTGWRLLGQSKGSPLTELPPPPPPPPRPARRRPRRWAVRPRRVAVSGTAASAPVIMKVVRRPGLSTLARLILVGAGVVAGLKWTMRADGRARAGNSGISGAKTPCRRRRWVGGLGLFRGRMRCLTSLTRRRWRTMGARLSTCCVRPTERCRKSRRSLFSHDRVTRCESARSQSAPMFS